MTGCACGTPSFAPRKPVLCRNTNISGTVRVQALSPGLSLGPLRGSWYSFFQISTLYVSSHSHSSPALRCLRARGPAEYQNITLCFSTCYHLGAENIAAMQ